MYTIHQYSLKEYEIISNSSSDTIYYQVEKYSNLRSNPHDTTGVWDVITNSSPIGAGDNIRVILPNDGVYRIKVSSDSGLSTVLDVYIVHNITNLLEKKQYFLTKLLTEYRTDAKHHNQYYDFIAFSVLFESYNKIVKDSFIKTPGVPNLYMIEYLLEQLQKFYYNG